MTIINYLFDCLFLVICQQNYRAMIGDKIHQIQDVRGWSHQQEISQDQQILNNLLKRKITLENLPKLTKAVSKSYSPKKFKQSRISNNQKLTNPQSHNIIKIIKKEARASQRSQQCDDGKTPLKQKLLQMLSEQDQIPISPIQTIRKQQIFNKQTIGFLPSYNINSQSKLTNHQKMEIPNARIKTIYEKREQMKLTSLFKRYDIENRFKSNSLVNDMDSKTYQLKLHTIDQCKIQKKKFFERNQECKLDQLEEQILKHEQQLKRQKRSRNKLERIERATERLKQTFVKQDILERSKKRNQKIQKLQQPGQFSDQQIFNHSSIQNLPPALPSQSKQSKVHKLNNLQSTIRYKLLLY